MIVSTEIKAVFMILVTERKSKDSLLNMLREKGINLIDVMYGRGAASEGFIKNMLGLITEENKVVISCITTQHKSERVLGLLVDKYNFDQANTGIAFTIPIESISY